MVKSAEAEYMALKAIESGRDRPWVMRLWNSMLPDGEGMLYPMDEFDSMLSGMAPSEVAWCTMGTYDPSSPYWLIDAKNSRRPRIRTGHLSDLIDRERLARWAAEKAERGEKTGEAPMDRALQPYRRAK